MDKVTASLNVLLAYHTDACQSERKHLMNPYHLDLKEIQEKTIKIKKEDQFNNLALEATMGIINTGLRKVIRAKVLSKNVDEADLIKKNTKKEEAFKLFLLARRQTLQQETIDILSSKTRDIFPLGDLISYTNAQSAANFRKLCGSYNLLDLTLYSDATNDDISPLLGDSWCLIKPKLSQLGILSADRLTFSLPGIIPTEQIGQWNTLFSNKSLNSRATSATHQLIELIDLLKSSASQFPISSQTMVQNLANICGIAYKNQRIFEYTLFNPIQATDYLRRHLHSLNFTINQKNAGKDMDDNEWTNLIDQFRQKLSDKHKYYFEIIVPRSCDFRLGFLELDRYLQYSNVAEMQNQVSDAMYFTTNGEALYKGKSVSIMEKFISPSYVVGTRTIGFLLDRLHGSLSLSLDSKFDMISFGHGSNFFSSTDIEEQIQLLKFGKLKLFVSLIGLKVDDKYSESPLIRLNFGSTDFSKSQEYSGLDTSEACNLPILPVSTIIAKPLDPMEAQPIFTAHIKASAVKSFSNFPPTAHRKSLCASIIQRAWKRYHGKAVRDKLRLLYISAAIIIQTVFRKKLSVIMARKNGAARVIQRNWRLKLFIHASILKAIYRRPLKVLHGSATIIQTEFRRYYLFKTSPFAVLYQKSLDVLYRAADKITQWWRKMVSLKGHKFAHRTYAKAILTIQRVFRGYSLRKMMRADIREKLKIIGTSFVKNRNSLRIMHSCYVIQKAWRRYAAMTHFKTRMFARNQAAKKIQALWRGVLSRNHGTTHLSYGQSIFLRGVCKSLRACHYIVKIYRPCGIVCPPKKRMF